MAKILSYHVLPTHQSAAAIVAGPSRDLIETVKKAKLPEDESKRLEKDIQAVTDKAIADINSHLAHKEKDLLTV